MMINFYQNTMNKNINTTFNNITGPRLTTEEMEQCQTRGGSVFKITSIHFEDNKPHFPTKALGHINTNQGWKLSATWNQLGECIINGLRVTSCDLIGPNRKEINNIKPMV